MNIHRHSRHSSHRTSHSARPVCTLTASIAALLLAPGSLHAADRYWIDSAGGNFSPNSKWSLTAGGAGGAIAPGVSDVANFTLNNTYTVEFFVSPTNTDLNVDNGNVTFDLNGNSYTGTSSICIEVGRFSGQTGRLTILDGTLGVDTAGDNVWVGANAGATGFLTIGSGGQVGTAAIRPIVVLGSSGSGTLTIQNDGKLFATSLVLGDGSGSSGTATITGPQASVDLSASLSVASGGTGSLTVSTGASLTSSSSAAIGTAAGFTGTVTVTGAGSQWTQTGAMTVATSGVGILNVSSSGTMATGSAITGHLAGGVGTASISGTGSEWAIAGSLTVGNSGEGALNITNGGRGSVTGSTFIGNVIGSQGSVSVSGANARLDLAGTMNVGRDGTGALTISDGGQVSSLGSTIGSLSMGVGQTTITGTGSSLNVNGTLTVAALGAGTLTVESGATLNVTSTLSVNDPAGAQVGTLNFHGGSITAGGFSRAAGAILNWTDGTLTIESGTFNNASANLTLNGAGAGDLPTLHLSGSSSGPGFETTTLTVGSNRAGALQITGNSTLSTLNLLIAAADGGNGTVTVGGGTANLAIGSTLVVGGQSGVAGGTGTLNIGGGGTVTTNSFRTWSGATVNLDGGTLETFTFTNSGGQFNFNAGTMRFTGSGYSGGFGSVYDALLGFEHRLTAGKTIAYAGSFNFTGLDLVIDGGRFDTATALTVGSNSILDVRAGNLTASTLANNAAGQIVLAGGSVELGTTFTNPGDLRLAAANDFALITGTTLTNTGLIHGNGRVGMGLTNDSGGEVRAAAGERMVFTGASINNAKGRIEVSADGDLQFTNTLGNHAAIDVLGGTLRVDGTATNAASTASITARNAILRFNGGLTNDGSLALSFGTSDVFGDIVNSAATGRIVVSGNSNATFYDDLINNGAVQVSAGSTAVYFGAVSGTGSFPGAGTNFFEGDLAPGASPALVTFGGDVIYGTFVNVEMELGGTARGTQYDAINVAGSLTLDGTLTVPLINGFAPQLGQSFDLFDFGALAGAFTAMNLPLLGPTLAWNISQLYTTGIISVSSTLTPIEQWRQLHFGIITDSGDAADLNDFDFDGFANLIEYALAMDPRTPNVAGAPVLGVVNVAGVDYLSLTITRPLSATDISYRFQVGSAVPPSDAGSFYSAGGDVPTNAFTTQVSRTDDGTFETIVVRDNTPMNSATSRFMTLKVSNPS
jgi:T5SS/PEP-CTERM-associated repeat protein